MAKTFIGTGRRKRSIARVRMTSGKGKITINGRDVNEYLPFKTLVMDLKQPLEATKTADKFDIEASEVGSVFLSYSSNALVIPKRIAPVCPENPPPYTETSISNLERF